jgi:phosphate starvation-inducible PhoH-like protein
MKKAVGGSVQAKSLNQKKYVKNLQNENIKILFAIGPAGTGKTYLACNEAISQLKNNIVNKIILTRPVVPVEEDIGFLPGTMNKKMDPWTRPILDIFEEKYSKTDIEIMMKQNIIEISPLGYMRGRTFKNAFIIADEMQNSSPNQMLMLTTRIGENSKMVITGDLQQSDKSAANGLQDFMNKFYRFQDTIHEKYRNANISPENSVERFIMDIGICITCFTNKDIQRSPVVSNILEIYEETYSNPEVKTIQYEIERTEVEPKEIKPKEIKPKEIKPKEIETKPNKDLDINFNLLNDAAMIPLSHYK